MRRFPAIGTPGVLVTRHVYDAAGNEYQTYHPDGTVTMSEFDALGRLLLTTHNATADGTDGNHPQRTAYKYDAAGRLTAMAAVLPDHAGGAVTEWSQINWAAADGTIQVTSFEYAAAVKKGSLEMNPAGAGWSPAYNYWTYDENGNPIAQQHDGDWMGLNESAHNGWVSKVTYPEGDWLTFAYYADGSVATRTDSKGNVFYHAYDLQGRRTKTWIDDQAYYNPTGMGEAVCPAAA